MTSRCSRSGPWRRRTTWLLLASVASLFVALLVLILHRGQQPAMIIRGGLIEVEYTTANTDVQQAAARRCGLDEVADLTPTHIRYAVTPGKEGQAGDCLQRQGIVRAVAILG